MYKAHMLHHISAEKKDELKQQYTKDPYSFFTLEIQEIEALLSDITQFYYNHLMRSGLSGYVLGLSGGLDSSIVALLTVRAVGKERVSGIVMPSSVTAIEDQDDAQDLARKIGIELREQSDFAETMETIISLFENLSEKNDHNVDLIRKGNMYARVRMIILRDYAKAKNLLVAGTGNASEIYLGYSTIAGDGLGGVDNLGLYHIFKSQEPAIARYLNVPQRIIQKAPSAGLWKGQTDENELGGTYEVIDGIILGQILGFTAEEVHKILKPYAISQDLIQSIYKRIERNAFKSELPKYPE